MNKLDFEIRKDVINDYTTFSTQIMIDGKNLIDSLKDYELPLAKKEGGKLIEATPLNAATGAYPLSRFLYVYVNKAPNKPLDPLQREFVKMVLSQVGQEVVVKDGYVPLPSKVVNKYLSDLGIQ